MYEPVPLITKQRRLKKRYVGTKFSRPTLSVYYRDVIFDTQLFKEA